MHAHSSATSRRSGFSLIEMLIVVAMIGIMAAIALPRVRVERQQVDSAARTIAYAMMTARSDAVSRGHNVLVVFDTARATVRTIWDANNNMMAEATEKTRPFPLPERIAFGRGFGVPAMGGATAQVPVMRSASNLPALVLTRSGSVDRAVTLYVTARRTRATATGFSDTRALQLDRATGRATVFMFGASGWRRQ